MERGGAERRGAARERQAGWKALLVGDATGSPGVGLRAPPPSPGIKGFGMGDPRPLGGGQKKRQAACTKCFLGSLGQTAGPSP